MKKTPRERDTKPRKRKVSFFLQKDFQMKLLAWSGGASEQDKTLELENRKE